MHVARQEEAYMEKHHVAAPMHVARQEEAS
jgi:hypothetical protein